MKSTGIVRKIDQVGRIVIPRETLKALGIKNREPLEIYVEGEEIILKKYQPTCLFCGEGKDIEIFKGKKICKKCISSIKGDS